MKRLWLTLVLALFGFGIWSLVVRLVRIVPSTDRVAIAAMGRDLNSPVSADFSRARYFLIVDLASRRVRAVRNPYAGRRTPVGLRTGELLLDDKVGVVLARGVRPAASNCLRARGIRVVQSGPDAATAEQALQQYVQQAQPVVQAQPGPSAAIPAAAQLLPELGLSLAGRPDGTALVTGVLPGSRASLAGLRPGDLVTSVTSAGQMTTVTVMRNNLLLSTRI
jgi:predicted Fe-Mo cluster-binding NifX family protein